MSECPVCKSVAQKFPTHRDGATFDCQVCGRFFASGRTKPTLERLDELERQNLSSWMRWNSKDELLLEDIDVGLATKPPKVYERAKRFLTFFANQYPEGHHYISTMTSTPKEWLIASWSANNQSQRFLLRDVMTEELGWLTCVNNQFYVSAKGWNVLESEDINSTSCFVAMWFDESVRSIYSGPMSEAIKVCGFSPTRVDGVQQNGKIDDQIIAELRRAKFVISDFTGHRSGVYYEAGFAHGLGKPVIFTCRDDEIEKLHFDVRQFNTIIWKKDDVKAFEGALVNRIRATIPGARLE